MSNDIFVLKNTPKEVKHSTSLVLVHGSWGASWMWEMYIEYLGEQGWETYALDLRGHGKSGGTVAGATMEDYVADVHAAIIDNGIRSPIIIGHSMGGLVVLMYGASYGAKAVVSIDPSTSKEVQNKEEKKTYPEEYTPIDAGMPTDPMEVMEAFPDLSPEILMSMKDMLGMESGVARSERKMGISVPKDKLSSVPVLFVGGELGKSVPFGIGIATTAKMANYYEKELLEIKGATHPGILVGRHAKDAVQSIESWLARIST